MSLLVTVAYAERDGECGLVVVPGFGRMPGRGGDGWTGVPGGPPSCDEMALATRTTGTPGLVRDTYTWSFRIGHPANCAVQIFVPDADDWSGIGHYDVHPATIAPDSKISDLDVIQPTTAASGSASGPSPSPDGVLQIQLTDQPAYPGGTCYVTASAATAACT